MQTFSRTISIKQYSFSQGWIKHHLKQQNFAYSVKPEQAKNEMTGLSDLNSNITWSVPLLVRQVIQEENSKNSHDKLRYQIILCERWLARERRDCDPRLCASKSENHSCRSDHPPPVGPIKLDTTSELLFNYQVVGGVPYEYDIGQFEITASQ